MEEDLKKRLASDPDGLATYEYLANNIERIDEILNELVENMINVDSNGQFTVSAARYLNAINATKYENNISRLVAAAIEKDRERVYIGSLLSDLWGPDYAERAETISAEDDNFRRIYKRIYPAGLI